MGKEGGIAVTSSGAKKIFHFRSPVAENIGKEGRKEV